MLRYRDDDQEKRLVIYNMYNSSLSSYFTLKEGSLMDLYN
jgi:hypothetical protein